MACTDCLENCGKTTSDQCVEYTGDPIPALGICTGDQLSKVEAAVITALLTALDGTGVSPSEVTLENCPWLQTLFVGKSPTLINFLQLLIDGECTLKSMIDEINSTLGNDTVFNTTCLSGLPANASPNQVLQALLTDYCTTKVTVAAIPTTYVRTSDLTSLVTQILTSLGLIGGSTTIQYAQYLPKKVILPYFGDLSVFDNTGAGLSSAGMAGIYLCNGLNTTPDLRGRSLVGAVKNVPGTALPAATDPTLPNNPGTNYGLGDFFGENFHKLLTGEMPTHTHGVGDPGHSHNLQSGTLTSGTGPYSGVGGSGLYFATSTAKAYTGITINSAGSSAIHENRQPSAAVYWIIRLN